MKINLSSPNFIPDVHNHNNISIWKHLKMESLFIGLSPTCAKPILPSLSPVSETAPPMTQLLKPQTHGLSWYCPCMLLGDLLIHPTNSTFTTWTKANQFSQACCSPFSMLSQNTQGWVTHKGKKFTPAHSSGGWQVQGCGASEGFMLLQLPAESKSQAGKCGRLKADRWDLLYNLLLWELIHSLPAEKGLNPSSQANHL